MLLPIKKKTKKKPTKNPVAFRINNDIVAEFKTLCKLHKISQSAIMENAMKVAIQELKDLNNGN